MKRNSRLFVLGLAGILCLTGCGNQNDSEAVKKVSGLSAIATTTGNVALTKNANNTIPLGQNLVLATKYKVTIGNTAVTPTISWTMSDTANTIAKENNPDENHMVYKISVPDYGSADLKMTLKGVIKSGSATENLSYDITVRAAQTEAIEYVKLEDLYTDVIKNLQKPVVKTYGYVVGASADNKSFYIQSGEYGAQIYGAASLVSDFKPGDLISVRGQAVNYNGVELTSVFVAEESKRTDIPAVVSNEINTTVAAELKGAGTKYDNQYMKATGATFVSYDKSKGGNTASFTSADGVAFALYIKSSSSLFTGGANDVDSIFDAAKAGDKFNLKGTQSFYAGKSLIELLPWNASDVAKAA
jgi:hypothetical protein